MVCGILFHFVLLAIGLMYGFAEQWCVEHKGMNKTALDTMRFVFGAGLEGSGHHAIKKYIDTTAKSCGYSFFFGGQLRRSLLLKKSFPLEERLTRFCDAIMAAPRLTRRDDDRIVIYEDMSFPAGMSPERMWTNVTQLKMTSAYDMAAKRETIEHAGLKMHTLYYNRDFATMVNSHKDFDGDFRTHAGIMGVFRQVLLEQYQDAVDDGAVDYWKQIQYDWFYRDELLLPIVNAWIGYLGLTNCDTDKAVQGIMRLRNDHKTVHKISPIDREYLDKTYPLTLPEPPLLLDVPNRK